MGTGQFADDPPADQDAHDQGDHCGEALQLSQEPVIERSHGDLDFSARGHEIIGVTALGQLEIETDQAAQPRVRVVRHARRGTIRNHRARVEVLAVLGSDGLGQIHRELLLDLVDIAAAQALDRAGAIFREFLLADHLTALLCTGPQ